jgi:AcrR family transcriptional regulator
MASITDTNLGDEVASERHAGRPLDGTRDDALRDAALTLLAEIGYDRLTIDAIAAKAGAGKATIYRRWSGKAELIVDALNCQKGALPTPDTGSLLGDLEVLADAATQNHGQTNTEVMIGLISALPHDEELREVFRERLAGPHEQTLKTVFQHAIDRGEVAEVPNLEMIVSIIPALYFYRCLILDDTPDQKFIDTVIKEVVLPLISGGKPFVPPTA